MDKHWKNSLKLIVRQQKSQKKTKTHTKDKTKKKKKNKKPNPKNPLFFLNPHQKTQVPTQGVHNTWKYLKTLETLEIALFRAKILENTWNGGIFFTWKHWKTAKKHWKKLEMAPSGAVDTLYFITENTYQITFNFKT